MSLVMSLLCAEAGLWDRRHCDCARWKRSPSF